MRALDGAPCTEQCSRDFPPVVVLRAFNLSAQKAEAGGSFQIQSQPGLYSELQDSQGYIKPCIKKKKKVASPVPESMAFSGEELAAGLEGRRETCALTVTPVFWTPFLHRPGPGLHPAQDT